MKIIFDLDETLIYNSHDPKSSLKKFELVYSPRMSDQFMLRPHAREVLCSINSRYEVILASFSTKNRIDQILRVASISDCFIRVFPRESLDPCYRNEKTESSYFIDDFILVDDKGLDDKHTQAKLKFFGSSIEDYSARLLKVPAFRGNDSDKELLSVLQEVNRRLQLAGRKHETVT